MPSRDFLSVRFFYRVNMNKKIGFTKVNAAGRAPKQGLYDPAFEHDACGVGFVARQDGVARHRVVADALKVLVNLAHRGAVGADKSTGDGAGILLAIPDAFFRAELSDISLPQIGDYAVGMLFLPRQPKLRDRCCRVLEKVAEQEKLEVLAWRRVPVASVGLGDLALSTQPEVRQVFLGRAGIAAVDFERKLYVVRRCLENQVAAWPGDYSQFYISSLSGRTIVYKGLLTADQLSRFYPELGHKRVESSFAIVHSRYSTNTLPSWQLAQPFRMLAHNGEINTLRGNLNRMHGREALMASALFGDDLEKIKPVISEGGSDSAVLDNALELLTMAGRSLPHAMMMLVPEAWGSKIHMSEDKRAFYAYHSTLMEPWDGPAALVFADGRYLGANLDRNGLRPARYTVDGDGCVVMASESGVLPFRAQKIKQRGRLRPGRMLLLDNQEKRIIPDREIKARISRQKPYRRWVNENCLDLLGFSAAPKAEHTSGEEFKRKQHAFGYSEEELNMVLTPMANNRQEPIGSMGNDAALAVLSERPQLLFSYFKQFFAQVTNPPIDPLREEMVMSLTSHLGRQRNLLAESPEHCRMLRVKHPILTVQDMEQMRRLDHADIRVGTIDMLLPAGGNGRELKAALQEMFVTAEKQIKQGCTILVISDRGLNKNRVPIPSLLACAGLHHYLIRRKLRNLTSLVVETGEAREVMHFALLVAYGASAVCPYLALAAVDELAQTGMLRKGIDGEEAVGNYIAALKKGLLKTLSRMGISTLRSFFGSQIFEAVGLGEELVDQYFTGTVSRISGIGLDELAREANELHRRAFDWTGKVAGVLPAGGHYHVRREGEKHLWTPETIYKLQQATREDDYSVFREYTRLIDDQSRRRVTLRSLLDFKRTKAVPLEEVEPVELITARFVGAAMSFGSLSKEAHETVAIAMNRVGARSNSGEGGEDPARYLPDANGDSRRSSIKQVASGRFGVTSEYLNNADELQIKIAQGAKPGEGGQLPGHKVSAEIARVRHTTPGVTLISPPPHHDIYSIEDLAQLIHDLKMANPKAKVSVKLVAEAGVGTVAAGVVKGQADLVLISGHDGGTGASPLSSIKHAGLPWELGLAETQQTLMGNLLRDRIVVQVDGQLKTGRDLAIAALLGGEEFGFGTTLLVALGCLMMRKCHLNTCPMGVATQDSRLREKFTGKPEYVERFLRFIAQELREYMARLGFRKIEEMVGRADLLVFKGDQAHFKARCLDLKPLLRQVGRGSPTRCLRGQDHPLAGSIDSKLISEVGKVLGWHSKGSGLRKCEIQHAIRNTDRAVGAALSSEVTRRYGAKGLPNDSVKIRFKGSAGQSFGAFLAPGVTLELEGDANDYLGKGLSGGRIILGPPAEVRFDSHENIIAGNTLLYGATSGQVFIRGVIGERFAVRNSGARTVVEGVGDHCCEYMTGGIVVVLGETGNNFAAGMSGGVAYVYDESGFFDTCCNLDMVELESIRAKEDVRELHGLVSEFWRVTASARAGDLLADWEDVLPRFVKVMPIEYREVLKRMRQAERRHVEQPSATEEVYANGQ